jgi:hypothetical protein
LAVIPVKEKLVVQLYSEGKSYREISKIARISVRDIKPILHKYGADNLSKYSDIDCYIEDATAAVLPNSTKAYKLFAEGKSPLQVTIDLNLRAPEVKVLFQEFWELRRMRSLARLYDEIGDQGVSSLLQLYRSCKAQQISNDQIVSYLTTFGNYLPAVQIQYQSLQNKTNEMLSKKCQLETEFEDLNTRIGMTFNLLKSLQLKGEAAERELSNLANEKLRLTRLVSEFRLNNGILMRIERFIREKINMILRDNTKLLEISLMSALNAFRNDPDVYRYLLHKLDQTTISELLAIARPNTNLPPYFQRVNTSPVRANNNNKTILKSHSQADLRYHVQTQRRGDFCYACYSDDAEGISRTYFENLGKEIISDIGLNSFDGIYAASHCTHYDYQQY